MEGILTGLSVLLLVIIAARADRQRYNRRWNQVRELDEAKRRLRWELKNAGK
jgi:hypothetical protein